MKKNCKISHTILHHILPCNTLNYQNLKAIYAIDIESKMYIKTIKGYDINWMDHNKTLLDSDTSIILTIQMKENIIID